MDNFRFDDEKLDYIDNSQRKEIIFDLFKRQFLHNRENIPFYSKLYGHIDSDEIKSYEDCIEKIPLITKINLRNLKSPYDLTSYKIQNNFDKIYIHRGTGGTTGEPVSMLFSYNDWQAILGGMTRSLKEIKELKKHIVAYNGYHQGHISGPIFDDTIRKIGGTPVTRNFNSTDEQALKLMIKHRCNLIIAPSISTHKGGSVEDLLEIDAKLGLNYINGKNIDCIFCSSTNLTKELYTELMELGIKYIYNYYGSTDVLPTAISCQENPLDLHILPGHIAIFVVGKDGKHVKNGERGLVVASRIGSYDESGDISVNEATQIMNFHVGDEVTFIDEPCSCGRTTPRIRDVKRVSFIKEKLESGCEVW